MKIKFFIIVLLQLFLFSCDKEYVYRTAFVHDADFVHSGGGYYKLKIFYSFEYNDSIYEGCAYTPGRYRIYGRKRFREGDSVFIKFPVNKPEKNQLANYKIIRME